MFPAMDRNSKFWKASLLAVVAAVGAWCAPAAARADEIPELEEPILQTGLFRNVWSRVSDAGEYCSETFSEVTGCPELCPTGWCEDLGDPWTLDSYFDDDCCGRWLPFSIGGWVSSGYHSRSDGVFNTVPDNYNFHQAWLYAEKLADGSDGLDWGFRADVLYGIDGENTQAYGNNPGRWDFANGFDHGVYHWALPQAYVELEYDNINVKGGHFFTPLGYEVVQAPGNFFYSHAFTHNFSEPFTHTGMLTTIEASDSLTIYSGWTLGWDTGFDRFHNGFNYIGGLTYAINDNVSATYLTTYGNLGWIGKGYSHSIVVNMQWTDRLESVLSSDLVRTQGDLFGGNTYHTLSFVNYTFYTVNDCLKLGTRSEWWKAQGVSYNTFTFGANIKPHANITIRPEIRYQLNRSEVNNPIGLPVDLGIFGIDSVITF